MRSFRHRTKKLWPKQDRKTWVCREKVRLITQQHELAEPRACKSIFSKCLQREVRLESDLIESAEPDNHLGYHFSGSAGKVCKVLAEPDTVLGRIQYTFWGSVKNWHLRFGRTVHRHFQGEIQEQFGSKLNSIISRTRYCNRQKS